MTIILDADSLFCQILNDFFCLKNKLPLQMQLLIGVNKNYILLVYQQSKKKAVFVSLTEKENKIWFRVMISHDS